MEQNTKVQPALFSPTIKKKLNKNDNVFIVKRHLVLFRVIRIIDMELICF